MHVANIKPKMAYKPLTDLIEASIGEPAELEANGTYLLHHNGGDAVCILTQQNVPENNETGYVLRRGENYTYKNDGLNVCYVRSLFSTSSGADICVESVV